MHQRQRPSLGVSDQDDDVRRQSRANELGPGIHELPPFLKRVAAKVGTLTSLPTVSANAAPITSLGNPVPSPAQSRKDERKLCTVMSGLHSQRRLHRLGRRAAARQRIDRPIRRCEAQ